MCLAGPCIAHRRQVDADIGDPWRWSARDEGASSARHAGRVIGTTFWEAIVATQLPGPGQRDRVLSLVCGATLAYLDPGSLRCGNARTVDPARRREPGRGDADAQGKQLGGGGRQGEELV